MKPKAGWRVAVLVVLIALAVAPLSRAQGTTVDTLKDTADTLALKEMMQTAERVASIEANKAAFVSDLLARWTDEAAARGWDAYWTKGTRKLMAKSGEQLLRLSERATDLDTFQKLAFGGYTTNRFGSLTQELVFFPMAGCRIYDSRLATGAGLIGPMAPGTQRNISVNDTIFLGQGGTNPECGATVPDLSNDPPALALTITATNETGPGNLRTFAAGGTVPAAAALTYTAGTTISTGTITDSCTSCSSELTVRNQGGGNTDVVIDVVGYFHAPLLQALDCTTVSTVTPVSTGVAFSFESPACAAGTTLTGGGFNVNLGGTPDNDWFQSSPNAASTAWTCRGINSTAFNVNETCYARCCSVPGR